MVWIPCGEILNFRVAYLSVMPLPGIRPNLRELSLQSRFEIRSVKNLKLFVGAVGVGEDNNR